MAKMIIKDWCPECLTVNYVNNGDPQDCTGRDLDGIQCWNCKRIWLFDDDPPEYVDIDLEDLNVEKGKETIG